MILKILIIAVFILSIILFIIARRRYKKRIRKEKQILQDIESLDLEEKVKEDLEHVREVDWELKNHNHIPKETEVKVVNINNSSIRNEVSLKDKIDISKYPLAPEDCFLSKEEQEKINKRGEIIGGREEGNDILNLDNPNRKDSDTNPSKIMIGKIVDGILQYKKEEEMEKELNNDGFFDEIKENNLKQGEDELLKLLLNYLKAPDNE